MSVYSNLGSQANVFENSQYFQPGRYVVRIEAVKYIQGHKGESFVIETTVAGLKSDHPDAPQAGERASQVWSVSGEKRDIGRGTLLGFLCSAYGIRQKDYDDTQWEKIARSTIEENTLAGTYMHLEVFMKKTRAGGDFTQHAWRGVATQEVLQEFGLAAA